MADYQTQIDEARRQGYADDEIIQHLRSKDPKVERALKEGYSSQEIMQFLSPGSAPAPAAAPQERGALGNVARFAGLAGKAAAPAAIGTTAGALLGAPAGPPGMAAGALIGGLAVPTADAAVMAYNALMGGQVRLPSDVIRNYLPGPTPETAGERVFSSGAEALLSTAPQVGAARVLAGSARPAAQAVGRVVGAEPTRQMIAAPTAGVAGQAAVEATDSPLAGLAAGTVAGGATGVRKTVREAVPSAEDLTKKAKQNYQILDKSGFRMDSNKFAARMAMEAADMRRTVGYTPTAYEKIAAIIDEMSSAMPKDVTELQALRKMIQGRKASSDAQERLIASELMDRFDDYIVNAPSTDIVAGRPDVIKAWEQARKDYSRMKKSEVFQDMIENADFTTTGKEQALTTALQQLARNKRRMRVFTPDEQEQIKEAAKGGKLQDMMRVVAKFTPMTPAAAIFTAVSGPYGAGLAGAGLAARQLGGQLRTRDVNRLAEQMRLGQRPGIIQGPFDAVPITAARGAMSSPYFQDPTNALVVE